MGEQIKQQSPFDSIFDNKDRNIYLVDVYQSGPDGAGGEYISKRITHQQLSSMFSSNLEVGVTSISSGTNSRLIFDDNGVLGETDAVTFNKTNKEFLIRDSSGNVSFATNFQYEIAPSVFVQSSGFLDSVGGGQFGVVDTSSIGGESVFFMGYQNDNHYISLEKNNNINVRSGDNIHILADNYITLNATNGIVVNNAFNQGASNHLVSIVSQGGLGGDIPLSVRNPSNTSDLFNVQGDGVVNVQNMIQSGRVESPFVTSYNTGMSVEFADWIQFKHYSTLVAEFGNNYGMVLYQGDINLAGASGTKIGSGNSQKLAFWGATPIVQPVEFNLSLTPNTGDTDTDNIIRALMDVVIDTGLARIS